MFQMRSTIDVSSITFGGISKACIGQLHDAVQVRYMMYPALLKERDMNKLTKVLAPFCMLSGSLALIGCESDFDKCMEAELPRALAELQSEIKTAEWDLAEAKTLQPIIEAAILGRTVGWEDPQVITALNAAGLKGKSEEELGDSWEKERIEERIDRLAVTRAHDLKCFDADFYDASFPYEPRYSSCNDKRYNSLENLEIKSLKGAMSDDEQQEWSNAGPARLTQHFVEKIDLVKAKAPENATLACNGAGIYE